MQCIQIIQDYHLSKDFKGSTLSQSDGSIWYWRIREFDRFENPPVKEIRRLDRSMISSPVERRCLLLAYKICVGVYENNVGGLIEPVPWWMKKYWILWNFFDYWRIYEKNEQKKKSHNGYESRMCLIPNLKILKFWK